MTPTPRVGDEPKFRIISNSLKPKWAKWDDPGDYPSNAGSHPFRSTCYIEDFTGRLVIVCNQQIDPAGDEWAEYLDDIADDVVPSAVVTKWAHISVLNVDGSGMIVKWVPSEWDDN